MQFNNSGNCYDCAALAVLSSRFSLKYLADILFSVLTLNTHKHWSAPIMVVIYCPKTFVVKSICKYWLQNLKNHFLLDDFLQSLRSFLSVILLGLSADVVHQVWLSFRDILLFLVWYLKGLYLKDQCMSIWMHSVENHLYTQLPNKLLNAQLCFCLYFSHSINLKNGPMIL